MLLISSMKKRFPARALPIPPATLTSVAPPWALTNSSDSIVRRRNRMVAPPAASTLPSDVRNIGLDQRAASAHVDHSPPAESSPRPAASVNQNHEIERTRTGFGLAKRRWTS